MAAAFTGDGMSSCLRPFGRSGCVTTSGTVWPAERIRSRVGTANSGVPRKTMFIGRLFPFARPLKFLDFALDEIALQGAQVIDKQDAVQVIDLVQKGAGQEILARDFDMLAAGVAGAHHRLFGAADRL